jgi:hypothetical protein
MAETPFVSKLKTYEKSMTTNHPRDFKFESLFCPLREDIFSFPLQKL